jgi:hypothetical protein
MEKIVPLKIKLFSLGSSEFGRWNLQTLQMPPKFGGAPPPIWLPLFYYNLEYGGTMARPPRIESQTVG